MPVKKSAMKRQRQNKKINLLNKSFKSSLRTAIKKVIAAVEANNKNEAEAALPLAFKKLDKAVSKGLVKKNFASRNKSSLAKKVSAL